MSENVKSAKWGLIISFFIADMLMTVLGVVIFNSNILEPVSKATLWLANQTLLVNLLASALITVGIIFVLGKLKPRDVGLLPSKIGQAAITVAGIWATAQAVEIARQLATGGQVAINPAWSERGITVVLGVLIGQIFGNTLYEDTVYRGFLIPQMYAKLGDRANGSMRVVLAVVISQGMFALRHIAINLYNGVTMLELAETLVGVFGLGILFAFIYLRTGNLFIAMGVHALANAPTALFGGGSNLVLFALGLLVALFWPAMVPRREARGTGAIRSATHGHA